MTKQIIQGSAPYFTFDDGASKAKDTSALLTIKLSDGTVLTKDNQTSVTNPIELPAFGQTFADVDMLVPTTANSIDLSNFLAAPYNYGRDDNGDGGITATGRLAVSITDVNNKGYVARNALLDICDSPYQIQLTTTASQLTTKYGNPNSTYYGPLSATYYVKPKIVKPKACYARPNSQYSGGTNNRPNDKVWIVEKQGFVLQDIDNPSRNFPTTGANNLLFNLQVGGTSWNNITYSKTPANSGISLTLSRGGNDNIVKITLKGPKIGATVAEANTAVPTTFTLYSDLNKTNKLYTFKISKWFIAERDAKADGRYKADFCLKRYGNNYRIPNVIDYTNGSNPSEDYIGISKNPWGYERAIGEGLFSEWGEMANPTKNYYPDSDFKPATYWTAEQWIDVSLIANNTSVDGLVQRTVTSSHGAVVSHRPISDTLYYSCVTP